MTRLQKIKNLELMLASCRDEAAALVREALCNGTDETRRIEALITRAALQARSSVLSHQLRSLCSEPQETSSSPANNGSGSDPWAFSR